MNDRTEFIVDAPRTMQDGRGVIRTFTGLYVNPLAMRPADIDIRDIAHHLSLINRYTGASPEPFSVAQHSVMGTEYFRSAKMKLAFLLHDSAEAYFNDLASPVKHDPRMQWYRVLEHDTTKLIYTLFGLEPGLLELTKPADDRMFRREVANWWGVPEPGDALRCWPAKEAEREFLCLFYSLCPGAAQ